LKKIPMRTCIICRQKTDKRSLNRIVRTPEGPVAFDPGGKKNGRGAYICSEEGCLELAKNRKKIEYALQSEVSDEDLVNIRKGIQEYLLEKEAGGQKRKV
jgi:predicted RNA-binding protein YlxR (DUF448 family)